MIRSNPPGAMVYVDNQPIGTTPCATNFTYYGTREIRLVKPGYETLTINQPLPAPWYELPPIDFVSENLVPQEIQDYRTLAYNLSPQVIVPTEQLLARADQLRISAQQGTTIPVGGNGTPVDVGGSFPAFVPASPPASEGTTTLGPAGSSPNVLVPSPGWEPLPSTPGVPRGGQGVLPPGGQPLEPLRSR
jgi:hypothetical protein